MSILETTSIGNANKVNRWMLIKMENVGLSKPFLRFSSSAKKGRHNFSIKFDCLKKIPMKCCSI